MDRIQLAEKPYLRKDIPDVRPGDTVEVDLKVKEGDKERIQTFAGTDRQCRGRLLDVLRDADGPVHRSALETAWDLAGQRGRALDGLLADGLVVAAGPTRYALPD